MEKIGKEMIGMLTYLCLLINIAGGIQTIFSDSTEYTKEFGCYFRVGYDYIYDVEPFDGKVDFAGEINSPMFSLHESESKYFCDDAQLKEKLIYFTQNMYSGYTQLPMYISFYNQYKNNNIRKKKSFDNFFKKFKPDFDFQATDPLYVIHIFDKVIKMSRSIRSNLGLAAAKEYPNKPNVIKGKDFGPTHLAGYLKFNINYERNGVVIIDPALLVGPVVIMENERDPLNSGTVSNQRYKYSFKFDPHKEDVIIAEQTEVDSTTVLKTKVYNVERSYCSFLTSTAKRQCLTEEKCAEYQFDSKSPYYSICFNSKWPDLLTLRKTDRLNNIDKEISINQEELNGGLSKKSDEKLVAECLTNGNRFNYTEVVTFMNKIFELQKDGSFISGVAETRNNLLNNETNAKFHLQKHRGASNRKTKTSRTQLDSRNKKKASTSASTSGSTSTSTSGSTSQYHSIYAGNSSNGCCGPCGPLCLACGTFCEALEGIGDALGQ